MGVLESNRMLLYPGKDSSHCPFFAQALGQNNVKEQKQAFTAEQTRQRGI